MYVYVLYASVRAHIRTHARTHVHVHTRTSTDGRTHAGANIFICIILCIYTCKHACMYNVFVGVCMNVCVRNQWRIYLPHKRQMFHHTSINFHFYKCDKCGQSRQMFRRGLGEGGSKGCSLRFQMKKVVGSSKWSTKAERTMQEGSFIGGFQQDLWMARVGSCWSYDITAVLVEHVVGALWKHQDI